MPNDTHESAPTQFVQSGDVKFAYRRFGPRGATPLLLCNYFAALQLFRCEHGRLGSEGDERFGRRA